MEPKLVQVRPFGAYRSPLSILCVFLLTPYSPVFGAQAPAPGAPQAEAPKIPNDQLDSLVAPIALYPDPLLAQMLAASTYPLEVIQLQQWLLKHKDLKGKALTDAVQKEQWDPSIQGMAALPDAMFVIDVGYHKIAVAEAKKLGIPLIGVVDTNHSPEDIDYVIPGNDDSAKAVALYARAVADAVLEGKANAVTEVVQSAGGTDEFVEVNEGA